MTIGFVGAFHFDIRVNLAALVRLLPLIHVAFGGTSAAHLHACQGKDAGDKHQWQQFFHYLFHIFCTDYQINNKNRRFNRKIQSNKFFLDWANFFPSL